MIRLIIYRILQRLGLKLISSTSVTWDSAETFTCYFEAFEDNEFDYRWQWNK